MKVMGIDDLLMYSCVSLENLYVNAPLDDSK